MFGKDRVIPALVLITDLFGVYRYLLFTPQRKSSSQPQIVSTRHPVSSFTGGLYLCHV